MSILNGKILNKFWLFSVKTSLFLLFPKVVIIKLFSCLKIAFSLSLSSLRSCHILFSKVVTLLFYKDANCLSLPFIFLSCRFVFLEEFAVSVYYFTRPNVLYMCYSACWIELGLFSFQKRRLGVNLNNIFKYLMGGREEPEPDFSVLPSERTGGSGHKLKCKKFHLNRLFLVWGWLNTRTVISREVVKSPFLEILKTQLDMVLSNLV